MGRSVYTDRNPSLIRELFTHEVVNEDAPANMKLAQDKLFIFYVTRQPWATNPFCEKERALMKLLLQIILKRNEWLLCIHRIYEPMHEPL